MGIGYRRALAWSIVVVMWLGLVYVFAQDAPPANYQPNETQLLRLQVKQRDAWLAQRDYIDAQKRYQQAVNELNGLGADVRRENKWPESLVFNADDLSYKPAPVPPTRIVPDVPKQGTIVPAPAARP